MTVSRAWLRAWAVIFACAWCGNQFSPLLLMYEERQHYSSFMANAFLGVYVLGLAPALLIGGSLSDRYGRKPLMYVAVLAAVTGSALLACGLYGSAFLILGRLSSGVAVGIAMAVGTSWVTELSRAPLDPAAEPSSGARRAALAFFLGSGLGALAAGTLAQWAPIPEVLPFLIHIAITIPAAVLLRKAPETGSPPQEPAGPWRRRLRVPSAKHPRFTRVIALSAPWLFAAAALGYGYLPTQLRDVTGAHGLLFATISTVVTLTASTLIQPLAKRVHSLESARGLTTSLLILAIGIALIAASIATQSIGIALVSSIVIGSGIGIGMVSGLLEVQRLATPQDLASLTGVFYALAYAGFLAPAAVAALTAVALPQTLLWILGGLALASVLLVLASFRKYLPS